MGDLQIRAARVGDAEGIAKVHVYTWQNAYLGLIPESFLQGLSVEQRTATWIKNIENPLPKSQTLVAEVSGEIVGFIGIGADREADLPNQGEVYAIYVMPGVQRRGIGTALMQEGLTTLKTEGLACAVLWVLDGNIPTRAWYESHGWRSTGRSKLDQRGNFTLAEIQYRIEFKPDH